MERMRATAEMQGFDDDDDFNTRHGDWHIRTQVLPLRA